MDKPYDPLIGDGRTTATLLERVRRGWAWFRYKGCGCQGHSMCARHFTQFSSWLDDERDGGRSDGLPAV